MYLNRVYTLLSTEPPEPSGCSHFFVAENENAVKLIPETFITCAKNKNMPITNIETRVVFTLRKMKIVAPPLKEASRDVSQEATCV